MRALIIIILSLYWSFAAFAQYDDPMSIFNYHAIDTTWYQSPNLSVRYTIEITVDDDMVDKMFEIGDSIFNDSINTISKLYIKHKWDYTKYKPIELSTIPIDHLVIDEQHQLIICFSRAMESPYHIVLYNFDGELLYKMQLSILEVAIDMQNYQEFQERFPDHFSYAYEHGQLDTIGGIVYFGQNLDMYFSDDEWDIINKLGERKHSHYFTRMDIGSTWCGTHIGLRKYTNLFSATDPLYDFVVKDSVPVKMILNDAFGKKVYIPLYLEGD